MNMERKNIIIITLTLLILIIGIFVFIQKANNNDQEYYSLSDDFGDSTYEFSGKSKHFKFNIGKVYFSDTEQRILIEDFQQTSNIKNLQSETLTAYFENEKWYTFGNDKKLNKLNETIYGFRFYESGIICTEDSAIQCEKTAFDLSNKDNFKDIIKVELTYCTNNNKCSTETFDITYNQ